MAWVILIGFAVLVAGVVVKVGIEVTRHLREDREAHGGRQTLEAARRAWLVIAVVVAVIIVVIVLPLVLGDS